MSKIIIFCADGTWNGPGETVDDKITANTNVFKLFLNLGGVDLPDTLLLAKEQERNLADAQGVVLQAAKYLHGVGDSENLLVKLLAGTTGAGLIVRIVRGYTFISRNYRNGDKICIVGFSRGAYTARALAGMIAARGLLDATQLDLTDKNQAYRLGSAVWLEYLRATRRTDPNWLGRLEELVLDLPSFLSKPPLASQLIAAPIEAVAVWETVGALGIPEFTLKMQRIDAFQFADTKLSPSVRHGIHAVAVDEQRADFTPTLWDTDPRRDTAPRITQALFPGAHSDVGGGYPTTDNESGLSDWALSWMTEKLDALGVRFAARPTQAIAPNPCGVAHQPWNHLPWIFLERRPRVLPSGLSLTRCLLDRIAGGPVIAEPGTLPVPYHPENLQHYLVGTATAPNVPIT